MSQTVTIILALVRAESKSRQKDRALTIPGGANPPVGFGHLKAAHQHCAYLRHDQHALVLYGYIRRQVVPRDG